MADRKSFDVSLVTPEGPAYEGEADLIIVPGQAGERLLIPPRAGGSAGVPKRPSIALRKVPLSCSQKRWR